LIDDAQVVRPGEIGSAEYIRAQAQELGCAIQEYELSAQFRCNGSDRFVSWVSASLGLGSVSAEDSLGSEFDFRIFRSPAELDLAIREKALSGHSARMMAGYCWPWSDPNDDGTLPNDVVVGDFARPWNAKPDAGRLAKGIPKSNFWAYQSGGIDQVGCVYTAQGFEFDYAGVIFGNDLRYDSATGVWLADKTKNYDGTVKRSGAALVRLLQNTYRVLLSRGIKGCYVCFLDVETEEHFKSRLGASDNPS
jgi:DUF2075 family protein